MVIAIKLEWYFDKHQLSFHLLADHLLSHPDSFAAVIDTTGGLELLWLKRVLLAIIKDSGSGRSTQSADLDANRLLARVRVIRAFDHIGIQEALDEVKGTHQTPTGGDGGKINFVIVDNLTNCFTPLIKTNYISGESSRLPSRDGLTRRKGMPCSPHFSAASADSAGATLSRPSS